MKTLSADTTVIGGGLAGLLAAHRLGEDRKRVILVDDGLPQAKGELGGFARFSGAKFSLPPAGLGLLPVFRNIGTLERTLAHVLDYMGLSTRALDLSDDINATSPDFSPRGEPRVKVSMVNTRTATPQMNRFGTDAERGQSSEWEAVVVEKVRVLWSKA